MYTFKTLELILIQIWKIVTSTYSDKQTLILNQP